MSLQELRYFTIIYDSFNCTDTSEIPCKYRILQPFHASLLLHYLEDIEFQIITAVGSPEYGMVRGLGAEFHLPQTPVGSGSRFAYGLCKELGIHEMGTGAAAEIPSVLHQLKASQIYLPVALYRLLYGIPRFCESRRIQYHHIVALSGRFQFRKQSKTSAHLKETLSESMFSAAFSTA